MAQRQYEQSAAGLVDLRATPPSCMEIDLTMHASNNSRYLTAGVLWFAVCRPCQRIKLPSRAAEMVIWHPSCLFAQSRDQILGLEPRGSSCDTQKKADSWSHVMIRSI